MKFAVECSAPQDISADLIIAGVFEDKNLTDLSEALDKASGAYLSNIIQQGDIGGKSGQAVTLYNVPGIKANRVLLMGMGKKDEINAQKYSKLILSACKKANELSVKHVACLLSDVELEQRDLENRVLIGSQAGMDSLYQYTATKSKNGDKPSLEQFTWVISDSTEQAAAQQGAKEGRAIGLGMHLTRELGNLPGNICTPTYLADQAKDLDKQFSKISTDILEEADMEKLAMGSLLSVSRGSRQPAKLIVMKYDGGKKGDKPVVLVGKGLTFDAGGISLKPAAGMEEMKYDMGGAASVFGAVKAIAELDAPVNLIGIVPSSENLPDGEANKPGDVVTSMSGQTIEIVNTDAEGRLILCDALTYAERFDPESVIDIATLTGACIIALGRHPSAMYANKDNVAEELKAAADQSADRIWQMPLWDDYQEQLKTAYADICNVGGRDAGSITAACFLARFTKKYPWAHLDIAGTAWNSGGEKGATGRPVPLLTRYVLRKCAN